MTSFVPIHCTICLTCMCLCRLAISCEITIGWQEDEVHLPALSCTQRLFSLPPVESPGMLTVQPFPGLADSHVHVQFSRSYSSNAGLPSTVLLQLIPKGIWAESNDPLWQPSHTAATPLIFNEMPLSWRAARRPAACHSQSVSISLKQTG